MSQKTVSFVRHGEADYNLLDRVNSDPHVTNNLTVTGREQAACSVASLGQPSIHVIYCSEFPRARQTAEIINQRFNAPIVIDPLINETGAFAFEGKPCRLWHEAQIPDRFTATVAGCESFADMKRRLGQFLDRLCGISEQHILVVSHEEPIQLMTGLIEGLSDEVAKSRPISHCFPITLQLTRSGLAS